MIFTKISLAIVICMAYTISLLVIFFIKSNANNEETRIYKVLLVANFIGLLLHLFAESVCYYYNALPFVISFIVLKGILLYYYWYGVILLIYLIVVAKMKYKSIFLRFVNVFSLLTSVVLMLIPIQVYRNIEDMIFYTYGIDTDTTYLLSAIIVAAMIGIIIIKYKELSKKKVIPLLIFIIGGVFSIIIQKQYPYIIIIDLIESVICCLMYFTIENPDIKMVQQLEIAKETADKANDSKTEFLSSMSHEIRTPLNAIVGFSDCIMDAQSIEEAKENAKDIVNASQTLLEIVNGILDISKIEAGKMEIINTKYNAKETFTELAKLITPRMLEKGLDFTYSIDPNIPATLYGDKANIKKIVTNFLSNACKYTDHGFVRYEVHCVRLGDYCRLVISVEDSGRGIKKQSVDKMFTRFQRLDEDRNTTIEGTGLGLAITKQLTELMGGKVIVHTIYGQGSKFTAVINQKIESMSETGSFKPHTTLDLKDIRILIVDDAPLNLKVASKLFQKYGANCIDTCSSGAECLEKIQNGDEYDLLFLDDMMPKMSGTETLHELLKNPDFHIPTIALTANAITGMREQYLASGFNDYLAKPIEQTELIRVCNVLLGRSVDDVKETIKANPEESADENVNEIIPVEDNIEEIIGDAANLDGKFKSRVAEHEEIELLDDLATSSAATPVMNLIPVVDIDFSKTSQPMVSDEVYDRSYLEKNGVDVNKALEMLGDMDMYNSTVHDFVSEVDEKWQRLQNYLETGDMENYSIDVHSLKSDCKYLGFMSLADVAYQHELKSKEKDLDYVKSHFGELEEQYKKTLDLAKEYARHNPVEEG